MELAMEHVDDMSHKIKKSETNAELDYLKRIIIDGRNKLN